MSHFYGTLRGQSRWPINRCGGKKSGLKAVVSSKNLSVESVITYDADFKKDIVKIYKVSRDLRGFVINKTLEKVIMED